jgi:exodeoxyribonuclease VIII
MITGKILDESSSDYHASDCISHSKLEVFRKRPLLYKKRFIDKSLAPEGSAAFVLGQAGHCSILEPTEYALRYVVAPDVDRRTKAGKEEYSAFQAVNYGKEVISREDAEIVKRMTEAVRANQIASQLLSEGEAEVTWRAHSTGQLLPHPLQCRTDWINTTGGYIADLKTIDSLDTTGVAAFQRNMVNFGYHRQGGFYTDVLAKCGHSSLQFYFIVVEKREPFGVVVLELSQNAITLGWNESQEDLNKLSKCYSDNIWPNLPTAVQKLEMPLWYKTGVA